MRIVTGICFSGFYIVTESWLNDRASNETRGKILSVYMVIVVGSMGLGQFLMNVAKPEQIDLFILISVIISFGLIPILLTVKPAPSFDSPGKMSIVDLYRASPLAVIGNCMTGMAHGTLFGLGGNLRHCRTARCRTGGLVYGLHDGGGIDNPVAHWLHVRPH